jgi:hypothetical protein
MSATLKQFLHEQAKKYQAEADAGKVVVTEWQSAVERLFSQIREWLKDADPDEVIEIEKGEQDVREPGLGRYRVPRLNLRVLGKWIGIIPKARRTVGMAKPPQKSAPEQAEGRVDITDELRRYVLYRFRDGDKDVWMIDGLAQGNDASENSLTGQVQYFPRSETRPFDQEAFEKALMSYLR